MVEIGIGELGLCRSRAVASLGIRGGMRQGGWSALYGWWSCRSIAEVSGCLPRHAMWGSDGRVEWKERGAYRSLAAGKGNMKRSFVHSLSFSRPFFFSFGINHMHHLCLIFAYLTNWKKNCGFLVAAVAADCYRPATRTTEASFLSYCFLRMWKRPPVT